MTITPTPDEMAERIVRFNAIRPKQSRFEEIDGIPPEAVETIAAKSLYLYMGPKGLGGANRSPGIVGLDGLVVNVAKCPPGQGPELHTHERTIETFMTLRGTFEVIWGDQGEHSVRLEEFDMISVPAKVMRAFRNCGSKEGLLLVLIQGDNRDVASDVQYSPAIGQQLATRFGREVRDKVEAMGWRFDAQLGDKAASGQ